MAYVGDKELRAIEEKNQRQGRYGVKCTRLIVASMSEFLNEHGNSSDDVAVEAITEWRDELQALWDGFHGDELT